MNDILNKYKDRLINISGRNRSFVSKKLPKKRAFDLYKLKEFDDEILDKITVHIINRDNRPLKILPDYFSYYNDKIDSLTQSMDSEFKIKLEEIKALEIEDVDRKNRIEKAKQLYNDKLQEKSKKIEVVRDRIIDYSVALKTLNKEINDISKETGRYELYIGYPFVEGKLKDDTFVRAPLMLFPISLIKNGDEWIIENILDSNILLNKVLMIGISKHNEIKVNDIETELQNIEGTIEDILDGLENNNIIINTKGYEEHVSRFIEYNENNMPNYGIGELFLKNNLVAGQFPIANSIYNDYEQLASMEFENELLEALLKTGCNNSLPLEEEEQHGKLSFNESDLMLISDLDYSQEKAVKMANETKQLVIYGPPGTGKSQTIANIISDALAKDKTVLMVSQKRAALDVIYNRLASLNEKAVIIHDSNKDKKNFYGVVSNSLDILGEAYEEYKSELLLASQEIDSRIASLEALAFAMHKDRSYGITLQEMYSISKAINDRDDERYEEFLRFKKNNIFQQYKYKDFKTNVEELKGNMLDYFADYKKISKENPFIDDVDINMNFLDIDEFVEKVGNIINPIKRITDQCKKDEYLYRQLMQLFEKQSYSVTKDQVDKLSVRINNQINSELLISLNNGKWWSFKYWMNYSSNKKKEIANQEEFIKRENHLRDRLSEMTLYIEAGFKDIAIIKKALNERVYNLVIEELLKGEDLTEYFNDIIDALYKIEKYKNQLKCVKSLNEVQVKILEYCYDVDINLMRTRLDNVVEFLTLYHILEIEKEEEVQKAIKYLNSYELIVRETNNNMKLKQQNVRSFILNRWQRKISEIGQYKEFKEFKRQANKKRALWPIRKYIDTYDEMVLKTFPCFLLSPEIVSEILPIKEGLFDIIIFDEASQMYVENAVPTIYRGKQVIVAGDDKQLRPNGLFQNRFVDENEEDSENEEVSAALEEESLLDLAKVNFNSVHLNYHYRSEYEELINFSNYAFYSGKLKISPNVKKTSEYGNPVERIKVEGTWINRTNIEEAEVVCDLVSKLFKERKNKETIGIITFNTSQRTAIENILEARAQKDQAFRDYYIAEIDRIENMEDVSLFVKNIENVQGDERDIIIFSTAYAKNEKGRVAANFGSLSQDGGENRLNVAISRAKKKIYLVTSIEPEDLSVESSKNNGPKLFKKYLQYVRAVSSYNEDEAQCILNSVLDSNISINEVREHDSDFEAQVYDALSERGYKVHTQVGVSGYKIDLGIYDERTSSYILGVECDGATYHSSKSARERDIHRQRYLESRGWKIIRIWSKHWWDNPQKEIDRIESRIKDILGV